ncbi:enzyme of heme biosynthesis [Chryseotalea sanaruensis]|uniref:Enzyme of heme biosynthesis n=1 Tax=Chryseotalea sanaruensis TaxID=2482724 RepID=A0A401U4Z9_9BACT|nr:tetratricopeptide repeat protein [Chryseotalea sanaruensis]GCC49981.1 enzyme of heme biosynthesis [Chryseotalea sanaruensis]
MNTQRIEMLKKLVLEDPNDPFYPYALALEYLHTQRAEAMFILRDVMDKHSDYLPSYYQAGLLSIEFGQLEEGQAILEKGIALAQKQNDRKALNELQSLLENI